MAKTPEKTTVTAYKAFNSDWTCRDFKYEVGKTYEHQGDVEICKSGFHACLNPFDVWSYYDVVGSKFALVEVDYPHGASDDSKIVSAKITISAELSLADFIAAGIKYLIDLTKDKTDSGHDAKIGSSGNYAQIGSSGHDAQIGSSGNYAQIGSSGHDAQIGSSGHDAKIGSSGNYAKIGSSGHDAQIGSSGNYAKIGSSGDYAQIGSSGHDAKIGSSGHNAKIDTSGQNAVVASAGLGTRAKGAAGTWISLAEFKNGKCVGFATGCIGSGGLEEDVWYEARDGKLVRVA